MPEAAPDAQPAQAPSGELAVGNVPKLEIRDLYMS